MKTTEDELKTIAKIALDSMKPHSYLTGSQAGKIIAKAIDVPQTSIYYTEFVEKLDKVIDAFIDQIDNPTKL